VTIRVTLQKDGKSIRREYKTHARAVGALGKWFSGNKGKQPVVYRSKHELPIVKRSTQTNFYRTKAWRELRLSILLASDCSCKICGNTSEKGAVLHVDHIKPRSLYPELALDEGNLQVLCEDCNIAKSNNDV